jgi:hypothetical protein
VRRLLFPVLLTAAAALCAERPELNGTWQLSSSNEGKLKFETLLIQQSPDSIKITESGGKEKPVDLACGVDGQECKLKEGDISFWYNGETLVMMETSHSHVVTKTLMAPAPDGKTLSLEVTRVAPPGPHYTYTFKKQP